jgi:L-threonylcarbamoyladenylate synthase
MLSDAAVARFRDCLAGGGVALFPSDTVYGLACDPEQERAVARLYAIKGRGRDRPAAVMFFTLAAALAVLEDLGPAERAAAQALLPGPVTLLLPNPRERYPLACGPQPDTLGLRVPQLPERLAALTALPAPVLQSSANRSGDADVRRLDDVDPVVRAGVDMELDGGELPGQASSVVDLRELAAGGGWRLLRAGALTEAALSLLLGDGGGHA